MKCTIKNITNGKLSRCEGFIHLMSICEGLFVKSSTFDYKQVDLNTLKRLMNREGYIELYKCHTYQLMKKHLIISEEIGESLEERLEEALKENALLKKQQQLSSEAYFPKQLEHLLQNHDGMMCILEHFGYSSEEASKLMVQVLFKGLIE